MKHTPQGPVAGLNRLAAAMAAVSLLSASLAPSTALAAPVGAQVTAGSATVQQQGTTTTVVQTTDRAAIDWLRFSSNRGEAIRFSQPSATSITLNRVTGTEGSQLLGSLSANGQVFILNPNGVLFGPGAQVNVGGLVASTLSLRSADFMAGNFSWTTPGSGSVVNQGDIAVAEGGTLALLAPVVSNTGTLSAPQGHVLLAAADAVTLRLDGGSLVGYTLNQGSVQALVDNGGLIRANGGQVVLTAKAQDALSRATVNHSGVIEAQTLGTRNGVVMLLGDMAVGEVQLDGRVDASAPDGGDGGFIETSAATVRTGASAGVTTLASAGRSGTWLIDPVDFSIAPSGGDITGAAVTRALASGNLQIQSGTGAAGTAGDILVNDNVAWSANRLTLSAQRNILVTADLSASGTASLALEYGLGALNAGNTATFKTSNAAIHLPAGTGRLSIRRGSDGFFTNYTVITRLGAEGSTSATDLQGMAGDRTGNYALGADIDASETATWAGGAGFMPVGHGGDSIVASFGGSLQGLGHVVRNLTVNRPSERVAGLFGDVIGIRVSNLGLVGANITGLRAGALFGQGGGTVSNTYASGRVEGSINAGGLIGMLLGGEISSSGSNVSLVGRGISGGLIGDMNNAVLSASHATGDITASGGAGGLVGSSTSSTISDSFATGNLSNLPGMRLGAGGLVLTFRLGTVRNSFATGNVDTGDGYGGGLIGSLVSGAVSGSYATGRVTGGEGLGGLIGSTGPDAVVTSSSASGPVAGTRLNIGGLIGQNFGLVHDSYATGDVSGESQIGGLIGYSTGGSVQRNYSTGLVVATGTGRHSSIGRLVGPPGTTTFASNFWNLETAGSVSNERGFVEQGVGKTTAQMRQQATFTGWDFTNTWRIVEGSSYPLLRSLTQGTLTLSARARDAARAYDQTAWTGGVIDYSGFIGSDSAAGLQGQVRWVGTAEGAVNVGTYSLVPTGLFSQNYDIQYQPGTLTIVPRVLDVAVAKTYDGNATFSSGFTLTNNRVLPGDSVSLSGSATVASASAGTYSAFASNSLVSSNPNYTANPINTSTYSYGSLGSVAATIDRAAVTALGVSGAREYDGTRNAYAADVTALSGVLPADVGQVAVGGGTGELAGKDVGNQALVAVGSLSLGGAAAGNYQLVTTGSTWTLVPRVVDVAVAKTYDGNATFSGGFALANNRVLPSDTVTLTGSATVASADAGTYSAFATNNLVSSNPNYTANPVNTASYRYGRMGSVAATIDRVALTTLSMSGAREYDGTRNAYAADVAGLAGVLPADAGRVSVTGGVGELAGKDVGQQRLAAVGSLSLGGPAAGNYRLVPDGSVWTLVPRVVDVAVSKTYDGNPSFNSGFAVTRRVVPGDSVEATGSVTVSDAQPGAYAAQAAGFHLTTSNINYTVLPETVAATIRPAAGPATPSTPTTPDEAANLVVARLQDIRGTVTVYRTDGSIQVLTDGTGFGGLTLRVSDIVQTSATGQVTLAFADGSSLRLGADTTVELPHLADAVAAAASMAEYLPGVDSLWGSVLTETGEYATGTRENTTGSRG